MNERKNEERNLLAAYYGSNAFVKIKQCLEIGKMQFSFVDKANSKNHIDCYMEAEEFGAILMSGIKNGTLIKALMTEKAKGEQYPKAVWTSPVGGNGTGNNGKPISRYFEISPGAKSEVLFTALSYPAVKNETGAFIKEKGSKPITTLRIPCTYNDLKILAYKWSFLEADYMGSKYTVANMHSDYQAKCEDTYTPVNEEVTETPATSFQAQTEEEEVPYVGTDSDSTASKPNEQAKVAQVKIVKLVATSELTKVPNKEIKVCKVSLDGKEKRLICLTDKFADLKRLADFEAQLKSRIAASKTLEFRGEICDKGDDLYLCKFA